MRLSLINNPTEYSDGEVFWILSDADPDKIRAVLRNGDSGTAIRVINSAQQINKRIMAESQYSENKSSFGTQDMRQDGAIPKTVRAFLNSDGGYLYIGIQDTGSLDQKLVVGTHEHCRRKNNLHVYFHFEAILFLIESMSTMCEKGGQIHVCKEI